jgi:hypothetical protein
LTFGGSDFFPHAAAQEMTLTITSRVERRIAGRNVPHVAGCAA